MKYLINVDCPDDVKEIPLEELPVLAEEVRQTLLGYMCTKGGHFGPNFGIIEATIALHYVFNSPTDKFIFDVSHQCYTHKLLTGRKDAYLNPNGIISVTGYSEPKESVHDFFTMGHTSTSISMACGMAKARDLMEKKENIIAIIGDGSLSGGEAYEGLECAAKLNSNFIVLLNDNEMSIANTNGGLYTHLRELRESQGKSSNNIFKAFGYEYVYLEEGNDVIKLVKLFQKVKDITHPIVIHIHTQKGKGYEFAENNKENWHWHPAFHIESGENVRVMTGENYDDLVGDYLLRKMSDDPSVIAIAAAVPLTIGFNERRRKLAGKQFLDVDIAEEHALSMAAGIAKNGGKPIVATFSTFFQRAYDQISHDICINNCPVTILIRNGSIWAGNDVTHIGWFDMALFSNIPNLVFLCPTNCEEYFAMLDWSIEQSQYPVAIRIPRNGVQHYKGSVETDYSHINKSLVTRDGNEIAVVAVGDFYQIGENLVDEIKNQLGICATLINPRFVSGIDAEMYKALMNNHRIVVTLEDGILDGGYGQKVASFYGSTDVKVLNYGLKKEFLDGYVPADVLCNYGITNDNIIKEIKLSLNIN